MAPLELSDVPDRGLYVVAVSGGVDSTVLLHLLKSQRPALGVVVAHVEHGIRGDASRADAVFVRKLSRLLGYDMELLEAGLGAAASEDAARKSRYAFLEAVCKKHAADGIMTAHHQDDVLETICLNLARGTGWRGLCSLRTTPQVVRPLLGYKKTDIMAFARSQRIQWRHDDSNDSDHYTRNRIRHHVLPKMTGDMRSRLLDLWRSQCALRLAIEAQSDVAYDKALIFSHSDWAELSRYQLVMMPRQVAHEIVRTACLRINGRSLLYDQTEHLIVFAATARPGSLLRPGGGLSCRSTKRGIVVGRA